VVRKSEWWAWAVNRERAPCFERGGADANEFPESAEAKEWIETYVALGASFLMSIEERLLVKDSAGRAFRWELWFARSSSQVLW
jgi:hypothetical protein